MRIATQTDSLFTRPLHHAVLTAAEGRPLLRSAILEAIRELSEQPEFTDASVRRRLVVISDLEENVAGLSFYRRVPDFAAFRASPLFTKVRADLRSVGIEVLYIPPREGTLAPEIRDFWQRYFAACAANPVRFRRI
jgi:hypothetical protein